MDIENEQVAIDKAMQGGLLGYPDIVGKTVTVEAVGPLGFVTVRRKRLSVTEESVIRRFFPRTTTIEWVVAVSADFVEAANVATGAELDRLGRRIGVYRRAFEDGLALAVHRESDERYKERLIREYERR